jgi:hypothetical protein
MHMLSAPIVHQPTARRHGCKPEKKLAALTTSLPLQNQNEDSTIERLDLKKAKNDTAHAQSFDVASTRDRFPLFSLQRTWLTMIIK